MSNDTWAAGLDAWLLKVDAALIATIGLGHEDLPDACYADMYDGDVTPEDAADEVLQNISDLF